MKKKDLAEEYLDKVADSAIYFKNGKFPDMPLFQGKDIKDAFNAGRKSVVDEASELNWDDIRIYGEGARYVTICKANKPLEHFLIQEWFCPKNINLYCSSFIKDGFKNIEEAKAYAKEAYKRRIKQALGL